MPITLTDRYVAELGKGENTPNVVIEVELDGGVRRFALHGRNTRPMTAFTGDGGAGARGEVFAVGTDELEPFCVQEVLGTVSSLQNKLDPKRGYSTRGRLTFTIRGRENFVPIIAGEYLKNRRVTRKEGFISGGFTYPDYATTFTGRILDWSRKGDELTVVVADEIKEGASKLPLEDGSGTQYIDYRDTPPVEIMTDILSTRLGIDPSYMDLERFAEEGMTWLGGVRFDRVITEPRAADEYLNELQRETNSFIVHDGDRISFKVFAPSVPSVAVDEWSERDHIIDGTFRQKSGYVDGFFNRVVVYYDYDESGGGQEENFEGAVIVLDEASQAWWQWDEVRTKVIKSRWIRSHTFANSPGIPGVVIYHASSANGAGEGTLAFDSAAGTLTWTPPGDAAGEAVRLSRDGKHRVEGADRSKYVRVLVTAKDLPGADASDTVTIRELDGKRYAAALATRLLNRYRDPVSIVSFAVDVNHMVSSGEFIKPTDLKDITTSDACEKGFPSWTRERVMVTSVRPDFARHRVDVEAVETKMNRRYGFIAPAGHPEYSSATEAERAYAFIANVYGEVGSPAEDGYYIW